MTMTAPAHDLPFDPSYGYGLDDLLSVPAPDRPDDFETFWRLKYDDARQVEVAPDLGQLEIAEDGVRVFGLTFSSVGVRLGGWLAIPDGPVSHGIVVGHGYRGRDAIDLPLPVPGMAAIFPCARGIGARSYVGGIPAEPMRHVLHGIQARERYAIGGCVADVWCAASALLQLVPSIKGRLGYVGSSFGGGIGALALPWDERFGAAQLTVPTFGQHPLRLTMQSIGSGEALRQYHATHPAVTEVLRYFDAAAAATLIGIPVQVAAALFDPAVPPPGQFAIYNALSAERSLVILSAGHFEYANADAENQAVLNAQQIFLADHLDCGGR
ncbi:cephalosporin-C deacetylase [Kribbella aluminosa]|uniref:Cephalosporin-C deacetylase n=1 Tax=Kribbella aluminosa TaxID=416017 RepID=A0ABS4UDC5_9ACTN|nr:acetylxylan esterase [Kribbella aluminosa]MBP2349648.1 cephalosporin-C deacetylase [Kribbella aluminosa]